MALDQGTTSTRAMIFSPDGRVVGQAQKELPQHFPQPGWVEHDPEDIWRDSLAVMAGAIENAGLGASDMAALGITNQRETALLWDRASGEAIHHAIVWQDRRTSDTCAALKSEGIEGEVARRSGLLLDPYFSATKIGWILDHVPGARARAQKGALAFGTVESFLVWRLTGGKSHVSDVTNASRTLLLNLETLKWDEELLRLFKVPHALLPELRPNQVDFGQVEARHLGAAIPILGLAGDQQAALIGQGCFHDGMVKSTYGTGCFALMNVGDRPCPSQHRLLATPAYQIGTHKAYALEGSIFVAGAAVQWLRDGLKIISSAAETEALAKAADPRDNVIMVPAFTGLGAPYWDADARGAIFNLTRASGPAEIARAALEAVCFQTRDLTQAMAADAGHALSALRVDGGMVANDWLMQRLADLTGSEVTRPRLAETTALGAAFLAGLGAGIYADLKDHSKLWQAQATFAPNLDSESRDRAYKNWKDAVRRVRRSV